MKTYLFAFAYEKQEPGFAAALHSDLGLQPQKDTPASAAVVAARSALYATLLRAGRPNKGPEASDAAGLARRILLAWAKRGFHDAHGRYRTVASFDCDDDGRPDIRPDAGTGLGLGLGRGVVYSVQA